MIRNPKVPMGAVEGSAKGSWSGNQTISANQNMQDALFGTRPIIRNWSGNHVVAPEHFFQPNNLPELEAIVRAAHMAGTGIRPVGEALSPNGLPFRREGMVSLARMNRVQAIDPELKIVSAQAGALVTDVSAELRRYGLCLPVCPSIASMSLGGYVQAGVHGTGARLPPADATVRSLTLVTPGRGTLRLSRGGTADDPDGTLFRLATVGLGALGVVAEVTLECDHVRWLIESTSVMSRRAAMAAQAELVATKRYVRYMWIPYTDTVVVVTHEDAQPGIKPTLPIAQAAAKRKVHFDKLIPAAIAIRGKSSETPADPGALDPMFLRQWLLSSAPLDVNWVARVNHAEAAFWADAVGGRAGWSDELLAFDCGGPQWVAEVAVPAGKVESPNVESTLFIDELLDAIESRGIPAPAPIEQRWTCGSPSAMSPVAGNPGDLFSWVGIVMYVPDANSPTSAETVSDAFQKYATVLTHDLAPRFNAAEHWAKITALSSFGLKVKRQELCQRFPVAEWQSARALLDPKNLLGNRFLNSLLPHPLG